MTRSRRLLRIQQSILFFIPLGNDYLGRGAVVEAIAKAHDEDVLEQEWLISENINTDALDGLFQERNLKMTLQFEADASTATVTAGTGGNPIIKIESHR